MQAVLVFSLSCEVELLLSYSTSVVVAPRTYGQVAIPYGNESLKYSFDLFKLCGNVTTYQVKYQDSTKCENTYFHDGESNLKHTVWRSSIQCTNYCAVAVHSQLLGIIFKLNIGLRGVFGISAPSQLYRSHKNVMISC